MSISLYPYVFQLLGTEFWVLALANPTGSKTGSDAATSASKMATLRRSVTIMMSPPIWIRRERRLPNGYDAGGGIEVHSDDVPVTRVLGHRWEYGAMEAHSDSDWLDVIVFDTSSWGPATDVDRLRWWKRGSAAINLRFFDMAPDFESLDPEYLRETLMESMGLVEAHGWPAEEVIGVTSTTMPTAHPTENMLIEVNVDSIQGVPVLSHTMRFLYEGQIRFATTLVILFKMCCWMLRMEVEDAEPVGEREAAVFRNVLEGRTTLEDFQEMVHPYERRWDGLIALEADPLSELRTFTEELVSSIRFGAIASELEPFVAE